MAARSCDVLLFLLLTLLASCNCWDNDDLEIFDLVEEVNTNFYELLGIDQSATSSEVRKAYRRLSLVTHPDKNDAEDAEEKFRQLVAIYEVLKDPQKREKYNQVLVDGLPDWRQPVFYYRRARKMGIAELCIVLFIILTVGHYFVAWGVYIERRLVVEDVLNSKKKKRKKKGATDDGPTDEEEINSIPTPKILDLWPFRLSVFTYTTVRDLPTTIKNWQEERKRRKLEEEEELALQQQLDDEVEEVRRKPKKKVPQELPEYSSEMYAKYCAPTEGKTLDNSAENEVKNSERLKKGEWSDEELILLSKAVNKFPGGTHQRWEKIAEMVGRSVTEVTAKTKATKGNYQMSLSTTVQSSDYKSSNSTVKISDNIISQPESWDADNDDNSTQVRKRNRPTKIPQSAERTLMISEGAQKINKPTSDSDMEMKKTSANVKADEGEKGIGVSGDGVRKLKEPWTQNQQTIFEWALKQYPKGTEARWDKVAEHIPGKTKEDCMARFKELALLISQKKKAEQQQKQ